MSIDTRKWRIEKGPDTQQGNMRARVYLERPPIVKVTLRDRFAFVVFQTTTTLPKVLRDHIEVMLLAEAVVEIVPFAAYESAADWEWLQTSGDAER